MKFAQYKRKATQPLTISATDDMNPDGRVRLSPIAPGITLPMVVEPVGACLDPFRWASDHRAYLNQQLDQYAALLFRKLPIGDAPSFERFAQALGGPLMDFRENTSPRTKVHRRVYTSTDYPANQAIVLHNEHSYSHIFPMKLFLFCSRPPKAGGQTPLADCRRILRRIPEDIRARFKAKKWMYLQNFNGGMGLRWQDVFQTEDRTTVEAHCKKAGIGFRWKTDQRLSTHYIRQAEANHPRTREASWFNHILFWHISSLPQPFQQIIKAELAPEDFPNNTLYGDGTPIEDEVAAKIRTAYAEETHAFDWQQGDLLMIDNMLAAHGRKPFEPPREVLFAMNDPLERTSLFAGEHHA